MFDLFLKADGEAELAESLSFAREGGAWVLDGTGYALDIIGPIVSTPAVIDAGGNEVSPAVLAAGFHANLRCTPQVAALVPDGVRIPAPTTPYRIFA